MPAAYGGDASLHDIFSGRAGGVRLYSFGLRGKHSNGSWTIDYDVSWILLPIKKRKR